MTDGCETVFHNSFIEERIYMDQPVDFISIGEEQKGTDSFLESTVLATYSDYTGKAYDNHVLCHSHRLPDPRYSLRMHATTMISQVRGLISYYQNCESQSYQLSLKKLPHDNSHESVQPDIAFALSVMSRYQAYAGEAHWAGFKTIPNFVFKLNGGVVAWKSSKQHTKADSTTEAECIAALEAVKEVVWMKNYIQKLSVVSSIAEPMLSFVIIMMR
ncbi:UNVERIFIED_CONTAM: hypothetical protein Scaly_1610400 [Sesamum calycinum]|uniref:Uncharacterized protein n=1 Tax=Sesamum calycinum TaxID=2727403 RepID=A0AAW2P7I0_9LAMI